MQSCWKKIKIDTQLKKNLVRRSDLLRSMRDWFYQERFVEVETPLLVNLPGMEPYLDPFQTMVCDEKNITYPAFLITSPEYGMKKMLAAGLKKIFQLNKSFRNHEPFDALHNPEFTLLEWYRVHANYFDAMKDVEALVTHLLSCHKENKSRLAYHKRKFQNHLIDYSLPWKRLSMKQAFKKYCNLNLDKLLTRDAIQKAARSRGYTPASNFRYDDIFFKIFLNEIEPQLDKTRPTFLYDYPAPLAALARLKKNDPRYAERFELYIGGIEIANAFGELTDAREQKKRLREEQALRKKLGKSLYNIDEDFIRAVDAMPEATGVALGVDRLFMLLLDAASIDEVLSFGAKNLWQPPQT